MAPVHQRLSLEPWGQPVTKKPLRSENNADPSGEVGVPRRGGTALLGGLVACGRCRNPMRVAYKPRRQYVCTSPECVGADVSPAVDVATLDGAIVAAFFEALAPDRLDEVAAQAEHELRVHDAAAHFADPPVLSIAMAHQLRLLGRVLPAFWRSDRLTPDQQKALLQALIWRIVLARRPSGAVQAKVVWASGVITTLELAVLGARRAGSDA
jgi:hypothetical protein